MDKSRHYLDLLDRARCNGNWSEIPELVRKLGKHLPKRKCGFCVLLSFFIHHSSSQERSLLTAVVGLQLTAQAEYQLATTSTGLSQIVAGLRSASQEATADPEDIFQARICLGWLHWTLNEPELALQIIPNDVSKVYKDLGQGEGRQSGWSSVCAIKGAYIRG